MDVGISSYTQQDLIHALIGGLFIGLATSINYWWLGRVTGNSGIFNTLIKLDVNGGLRWKFSFFVGLIYSSYILYIISKDGETTLFGHPIAIYDSKSINIQSLSLEGWIIGGLLVGIGTKLGNGCTSGHGVCGLPRLSARSLVAVWTFMAACAIVATFRSSHPFFDVPYIFSSEAVDTHRLIWKILAHSLLVAYVAFYLISVVNVEENLALIETPLSFFVGIIFGIGLWISGMCRRSKIYGFFTLNESWDPSLAFVMIGAIVLNTWTFNYIKTIRKKPFFDDKFPIISSTIDSRLIIGAAMFGIGWGITGMCPGPAMINLFNMPHTLIFLPAVGLGQIGLEIAEKMMNKIKKEKKD